MTATVLRWAPALVFALGVGLVHGLAPQKELPLRAPLDSVVPRVIGGMEARDQEVSEAEATVVGFDDYLLRVYMPAEDESDNPGGEAWVSTYVGYYESQTQGRTIHSPKNCLPGGGWEPLRSTVAEIAVPGDAVHRVNRYVLQRDADRALVLYWYQGRGRVAHNEYFVKLDLLKDAAIQRRTDEALVRIVVPVTTSEDEAFQQARTFAETLIPALDRALPL
ncbi:MAG: EpsI family protein [Longimicrobiales bacterium]